MTSRSFCKLALPLALGVGCANADAAPKHRTASAGKLPSALVGVWRAERFGDQICNEAGLCQPGMARREKLELTSDAKFEYSMYAESNIPPCRRIGQTMGIGPVTLDGDRGRLALSVAEGFTKQQDSC